MTAAGQTEAPIAALPGEGALVAGALLTLVSPAGVPVDRRVESISPGDCLLTVDGPDEGQRAVRAISRLELDPSVHRFPLLVTPVRIRAGAFAPGIPVNDLLLAPEAMVRVRETGPADAPIGPGEDAGHLIPVAALLNGLSIVRDTTPGPVHWLIPDLGAPSIILVEGVALASARIAVADARRPAHCLPIHRPGSALNAWRSRIAERAREAGFTPAPHVDASPRRRRLAGRTGASPVSAPSQPSLPDAPIEVLAAGKTVPLIRYQEPLTFTYELPPRTGPVRLRSAPRHAPNAGEARRFGACLIEVALDNTTLPFDSSAFGPGFHALEANENASWRWTNGDAWLVLPYSPKPRLLRVRTTDWHMALPLV